MPRRGYQRQQGAEGQNYPNRSDLQNGPRQAAGSSPSVAPVYGAGAEMAAVAGATPTLPAQATPPPATGPLPSETPNMYDPSTRPDEPLTRGLPTGPGQGPEAIDAFRSASSDLQDLIPWLPFYEQALLDPSTPQSVVTLVRRLRGLAMGR